MTSNQVDAPNPKAGQPPRSPRSHRRPVPQWLVRAAHVFALCGFAVAQPLLDLLGNNATFFVAHATSKTQIVVFALALVVVPPLVILGGLGLIGLVSPAAGRVAFVIVVGVLVGLTIVPALERRFDFSTPVYVVLLVAVSGAATLCYRRFDGIRQFASWLAPAPVLFLAVFLFVSPVHTILFSSDPKAYADVVGRNIPVVMLVLDEFPLGALLDDKDEIDANRFPNFARLAHTSTWYRKVATVSPWTTSAVPALLSGAMPRAGVAPISVPIASEYPRNIFTLLGSSHEPHVREIVTRLCPASLCGDTHAGDPSTTGSRALYEDGGIVFLHQLLPEDLADTWLSPLGERWAGFGADSTAPPSASPKKTVPVTAGGGTSSSARRLHNFTQASDFQGFLDSLTPNTAKPGLFFGHVLLPHLPYSYLPDGQRYQASPFLLGSVGGILSDDAYLAELAQQQLLLQTEFTDREIGRLLDRLSETGLLDDALLVVTADHGVSLQAGGDIRAVPLTDANRDDIMPVPLFVKYPRETQGEIDDRKAQTVDILPTIADTLKIDLPEDWAPDGESLVGPPHRSSYVYDDPERGQVDVSEVDATRAAATFRRTVGRYSATHDLFRLRPFGDLVGRSARDLATSPSGSALQIQPTNADSFANVDLAAAYVPVWFTADVTGAQGGESIAVVLNGTVAGTGRVFNLDGKTQTVVMVDPALLRAGRNDVQTYLIDPDGRELHPLR